MGLSWCGNSVDPKIIHLQTVLWLLRMTLTTLVPSSCILLFNRNDCVFCNAWIAFCQVSWAVNPCGKHINYPLMSNWHPRCTGIPLLIICQKGGDICFRRVCCWNVVGNWSYVDCIKVVFVWLIHCRDVCVTPVRRMALKWTVLWLSSMKQLTLPLEMAFPDMVTRLSTWWMLEAYKVMLCHADERESTNRATGSFVKNAVFEIANLPGDIWLHQCMALLKVHSLHLWRDKSKAALSALMPFIQWLDVLQTVAYDNGVGEAHGNSDISW